MKIYLACPYTSDIDDVRHSRFMASCKTSAELLKEGHIVISPISMSHPIAISNDLPLTFEFWQKQNHEFIRWCDAVYVLTIDGWETSKGVFDEIKYAKKINKEIVYIEVNMKNEQKVCKWCCNKIVETDGLVSIRESLAIPIGIVEPIDKMVIDGTCCLECFNRHSHFGKDWTMVGMRYCVKCGDPLYPPIANVIGLLNNRLRSGKLTKEIHQERIVRFGRELLFERERRQKWPVFDEWDQAFRDEILCGECVATGRNKYSISTIDVKSALNREAANV